MRVLAILEMREFTFDLLSGNIASCFGSLFWGLSSDSQSIVNTIKERKIY